jgi:hypothetical protein
MSTLIYVETTIPSFYTERRAGMDIEVRRKWTRDWWDTPKPDQQLVTSVVVFDELERIPNAARRKEAIALIRRLEELDYTAAVEEIAAAYLQHKLMPAKPSATPTLLRSPHFTIVICW